MWIVYSSSSPKNSVFIYLANADVEAAYDEKFRSMSTAVISIYYVCTIKYSSRISSSSDGGIVAVIRAWIKWAWSGGVWVRYTGRQVESHRGALARSALRSALTWTLSPKLLSARSNLHARVSSFTRASWVYTYTAPRAMQSGVSLSFEPAF